MLSVRSCCSSSTTNAHRAAEVCGWSVLVSPPDLVSRVHPYDTQLTSCVSSRGSTRMHTDGASISSCSVCGRAARAARLTSSVCRLLFGYFFRWRRDGGEMEARRRRAGGELEARRRRRRVGGETQTEVEARWQMQARDGGEMEARWRRDGGEMAAATRRGWRRRGWRERRGWLLTLTLTLTRVRSRGF